MYEEPYRWVEAVGNRRQYLDEQFKQGSPVVGLTYEGGILLTTVSKGTPKLYEIYDRLALGGMGHPTDLEKLRFSLLEMAHVEGFNRSPSDVTGSRLVKYGIAPVIKQAFEEVYKAPFIVRILVAELGLKPEKDAFLTINYDGTFEETTGRAVLAATPAAQTKMMAYLKEHTTATLSLEQSLDLALRAWAIGSLAHQQEETDQQAETEPPTSRAGSSTAAIPKADVLMTHLRGIAGERVIECAVLDRQVPGTSKYRSLKPADLSRLLPKALQSLVAG
ncbi:MAG: proteasome subunit alpha [Nitrospirae bacterium]|nr:proteasome subunit alpha [Nitrospirota bacterium]MDE3049829.1 proteasome subunit alpha [Nitrospirota bacterium]MDE3219784.1 proteasome subunit alpha [Nitrospirota bacterium]